MNWFSRNSLFFLVILGALAGCSPVTDYNPRQISTWQMLTRGNDLQTYLAHRRQVLTGLQADVAVLDQNIDEELSRLEQDKQSLSVAQNSEAQSGEERVRAETALKARETTANHVVGRIADLKETVNRMNQQRNVAAGEAQGELNRVVEISSNEIPALQADVKSLQQGVENGLRRTRVPNLEQ